MDCADYPKYRQRYEQDNDQASCISVLVIRVFHRDDLQPLLLEAGGFRLELHLKIVVPNFADLALGRALWSFMCRCFHLIPLQRPALLAPAIISALGYPDLTGRIGNALTLRDQYVNLLQLRGNFFRFVSLHWYVCI